MGNREIEKRLSKKRVRGFVAQFLFTTSGTFIKTGNANLRTFVIAGCKRINDLLPFVSPTREIITLIVCHVYTLISWYISSCRKFSNTQIRTTKVIISNKAHYTTLGARLTTRVVHVYLVFRSVWPSTNQWHGFLRRYASAHAQQRVEQALADRKLVIAVTDNNAFWIVLGLKSWS